MPVALSLRVDRGWGNAVNSGPAPGWYPDPGDASSLDERYWNGTEWTDLTRLSEQGAVPSGPPYVSEQGSVHGDIEPHTVGTSGYAVQGAADVPLVTVGEISCTSSMVMTPNGSFPIRGTEWIIHDGSSKSRRIPPYAIVLAILFALLCLIGLLFLLIQEDVYTGSVDVTVRDSSGHYFATSIPVRGPATVSEVHTQVNYCRYLAGL